MFSTRAAAKRTVLLALIVVTAFAVTACRAKSTPVAAEPTAVASGSSTTASTAASATGAAGALTAQPTPGLQYRLSEGSEQAASWAFSRRRLPSRCPRRRRRSC